LVIALRANTITSLIAYEIKTALSRRRFLDLVTDRSMMSPARSASATVHSSASLTSLRSGGLLSKKPMAARALLRAVAIGCVIS